MAVGGWVVGAKGLVRVEEVKGWEEEEEAAAADWYDDVAGG